MCDVRSADKITDIYQFLFEQFGLSIDLWQQVVKCMTAIGTGQLNALPTADASNGCSNKTVSLAKMYFTNLITNFSC